jgi:tetratricopeptide (TPR) repeat protein
VTTTTPQNTVALSELGATLEQRYLLSTDDQDIEKAVSYGRRALKNASSADNKTRVHALQSLSSSLGFRFEDSSSSQDIEEAVELARASVEASNEDSDVPWRLHNYAIRLLNLFDHQGNAEDLNTAIQSLETARDLERNGHETENLDGAAVQQILACLSVVYSRRFNALGMMEDLARSIECLSQVSQRPESDFWLGARVVTQLLFQYGREIAAEDIDGAIREVESALERLPQDDQRRVPYYGLLSEFYGRRSNRVGSISDMNKSIHFMKAALDEIQPNTRRSYLAMAMMADKLRVRSNMLWERHLGNNCEDLKEAIEYVTKARAHGPVRSTSFNYATAVLGKCLYERWRQSSRAKDQMNDIEQAIKHFEEALGSEGSKTTLEEGGGLPDGANSFETRDPLTYHLGHAYLARSDYQDSEAKTQEDCNYAMHAFEQCLANPQLTPVDRLLAGICVARLHSMAGRLDQALDSWKRAFVLVPSISPRSMTREDQIYVLQNVQGMSRSASADALAAGAPASEALKVLELGRDIIAGFALEARVDFTMLDADQAAAYQLARSRLEGQRQQAVQRIPLNGRASALAQWVAQSHNYQLAEQELHDVIASIQSRPETESFLGLPPFKEIQEAIGDSTIVVVNACERSDAFVINNVMNQVEAVSLPKLDWDDVERWAVSLRDTRPLIDISMLRWLWDTIASPVLEKLRFEKPRSSTSLPRIIWIMTGPLSYFPIHAAGKYDGSTETVMDCVVSSYSSSLKAFMASKKQRTSGLRSGKERAFLVGMDQTPGQRPLPFVSREIEELSKFCHSVNLEVVQMSRPQQSDVMTQLSACSIFHFAGHGLSDPLQPENGGLILKNSTLTVSDLLNQNLRTDAPFFGFLSACLTGATDADDLLDESIHLVSAFQLSGFRHVVGTMWQVEDETCGKVADTLYPELFASEDEDGGVARGLHKSVLALRDEWLKTTLQKDVSITNPGVTTNSKDSVDLVASKGRPLVMDGSGIWRNHKRHAVLAQTRNSRTSKLVKADWVPFVHFGV